MILYNVLQQMNTYIKQRFILFIVVDTILSHSAVNIRFSICKEGDYNNN